MPAAKHDSRSSGSAFAVIAMICGLVFSFFFSTILRAASMFFFFKQKTAYEMIWRLEFRRVLFRSYVREQEWEAAHTVWIWPDRSPSMAFASPLVRDSKLYRTLVVALALAEVLVEGGERVGIPGLMRPTGSPTVIERMAQAIGHAQSERTSLPPTFAPA